MRRVLAQQWVSVDGFAAGPDGEQEIFEAAGAAASADSERHIAAVLDGVDVVLLGRRSYESFAAFWPVAHDQPMAARVNAVPKVVCSTTLSAAPWGDFAPARVVADGGAYLRSLREQPGGDVLILGSVALMRSLLREGAVDELELFVAPVALGRGTPLLAPDGPYALTLREGEVWASGTARLRYAVER